jgi:hypothetical protein
MEDFFSLEWFKARIENATDKALDERIGAKIDKVLDQLIGGEPTPKMGSTEKLVRSMKLVNDSLTVVLNDGVVYVKPDASEEDFRRINVCETKEEVLSVINDTVVAIEKEEQQAAAKKQTAILEGFNKLGALQDFEIDGTSLLLKGTSRTIPPLLVDKFTEVIGRHTEESIVELEEALLKDDEYQGLKNFFMWCCLNPRAEVADSLYNFLHQNGMKITKQGFFVALRNVVVVKGKGNDVLIQFISNAYNKVKAVWKKNPDDYRVVKCSNGEYCLEKSEAESTDGDYVGELKDLYKNMPSLEENRYTDNWTHTFDIRVGQVVSMPKEKCNWSTQDCATAGLHFAGHTAPYVLCGDTTVFTLHNPMKVVGIGREKGRCWEYLPFMTTNIHEAEQIMNSKVFDFLQLDEEYAIRELDSLAEKAKDGFTSETSKYDFNLPSISSAEINSIVLSLSEMKKTITNRVSMVQ